MQKLIDSIPVLIIPFITCLVIASLHCYMGLHVLRRGVIFVDLALAQCAALGAAVALLIIPMIWPESLQAPEEVTLSMATESALAEELSLEDDELLLEPEGEACAHEGHDHGHGLHDHEEHGGFAYCMSLFFALLGAVILSLGRFKDERVPHEAMIGIIFVVCAALSVLILSKAPHGHDKMEAMLVGSILFVSWSQVGKMALLYLVLGVVHILFRNKFIAISGDVSAADRSGMQVKLWDCLFFATFALMVTQSVGIAGVFVVFSYLIIPAACGSLFAGGFGAKLAIAWAVALITTVAGLVVSAVWDMPTGSSLVSCFGGALVVCIVLRSIAGGRKAPLVRV
jgi:zinc/manganese transport system permease protein